MRLRSFLILCALLTGLAACERKAETPEPEEPAVERVDALLSDDLPDLAAPATGVAFWEHPTLSFNSLLIVANENGVVSYNMENGEEVARIDGFNAQGAAVSYLGNGAQAAGFLSSFDEAEGLFRFYGVDNASRAFLPLNDGPAIRGAVRGFCMGRAQDADAPTLFVIQNARIQLFNLEANADGVTVAGEASVDAPDNLVSCAVAHDGVVILAADDGDIYRLAEENAFSAPFAEAGAKTPGDIAVIASAAGEDASAGGQILLLDESDGAVHVFDRASGRPLGIVDFAGTDVMPAAESATVMNASSANLGALYRDGVIAFGVVSEEGPAVRLAPKSSLLNALALPVGDPVSPRGAASESDGDLLISPPEIEDQPE